MYLIALDSWITNGWNWLLMGFSIGLIIFVHELGHFLVAKACGVKCEKFYLGFDVFGLKIVHFQWGETEYGIGALPLGGYVKMLGQDDNPARAAEEAERTKVKAEESDATEETGKDTAEVTAEETASADDTQPSSAASDDGESSADESDTPSEYDYELDPRSYTAKTVPQRMAIISAGVIMNLIFAVVFASIAYGMGVKYTDCQIAMVAPGGPAFKKGYQAGDDIDKFRDIENPKFIDLQRNIPISDVESGIPITIRRTAPDGTQTVFTDHIYPEHTGRFASIGIYGALKPIIREVLDDWPAGQAPVKLQPGDKIISFGGEKISNYGDLHRVLARDRLRSLPMTVERVDRESGATQQITTVIGSRPMKRLGLIMEMGKIVAVQEGSPAAKVGLKADDFIEKIKWDVAPGEQPGDMENADAGEPPGDPMTLPERLQHKANSKDPQDRKIFITLKRDGKTQHLSVELAPPTQYHSPYMSHHPMSAPALGIAYRVVNRVAAVVDGHDLKLQKGDVLVRAEFVTAGDEQHEKEKDRASMMPFEFYQDEEDRANQKMVGLPRFMNRLQMVLSDTKVKLTFRRTVAGKPKEDTVELTPYDASEWHVHERGLRLELLTDKETATSFTDAISKGIRETGRAMTLVFRTLQALVTGRISAKELGGMGTIFAIAGVQADKGLADLLIFMTLISANLAVINFLPIPILDGGHMVILTAEAIRRKPVSERILIPITYAGLFFILGLFLFVTFLDVGRGWDWLQEKLS